MTFRSAMRAIGVALRRGVTYYTKAECDVALAIAKSRLVNARRLGDEETASFLSQCAAMVKKHVRLYTKRCADCGVRIGKNAVRCQMHAMAWRYNRNRLCENY